MGGPISLLIGCFTVVYQPYYDGVICKFDYAVRGVNGGTVMYIRGVEEGAEETPLQCCCVKSGYNSSDLLVRYTW